MSIKFLTSPQTQTSKGNWSVKGLTIFSVLSFLINILNIIHGAYSTNPNSFGSHNTFADLVPISILIAGAGLWIITINRNKKVLQY